MLISGLKNTWQTKINKENGLFFRRCLEYINIVCLLLCAYSLYFRQSSKSPAVFEVLLFISLYIWIFSIPTRWTLDDIREPLLIALCSLACIGLVIFLSANESSIPYVLQKSMILLILIPSYLLLFKRLGFIYLVTIVLEEFRIVLSCLCAVGLCIWLIISIFGNILPSFPVNYIWGGHSNVSNGYLGLVFTPQLAHFKSMSFPRFTLFFIEAPLANFVFILGIMTELFVKMRPKWISVGIFVLSSLLTFSTASLILLPLIFICWITVSDSGKNFRRKNKKLNICILIAVSCFIVLFPIAAYLLVRNKSNTTSLKIHFIDFIVGVRSFADSPIWGHGIGNYQSSFIAFGGGNGQTSGLLSVAAQGGILLLAPYLIPLVILILGGVKKRNLGQSTCAIIILIMFTIIVIDNNPLFAVVLAFCYAVPFENEKYAEVLQPVNQLE